MKKVLKNVSFIILLLQLCIIFGQESPTRKRIVIDVGHGGKDSGAIGINGIKEKDVALNIGLEILRLNEKAEKPQDIYLTRYSDTLISLSNRTQLAKALNADLFISLHFNHSHNPNARGGEIYVASTISQYSENSTWFAYQLKNQFKKKFRGVKFAYFQVLQETVDYCPSLLLELGFLSNLDDAHYLAKKENVPAIAVSILNGL